MSYFVHQINQLETRKYKTTINQTIPKPKTQIPTNPKGKNQFIKTINKARRSIKQQ